MVAATMKTRSSQVKPWTATPRAVEAAGACSVSVAVMTRIEKPTARLPAMISFGM